MNVGVISFTRDSRATEHETVLDWDVCGSRSSDLPLDDEYPPAVRSLPPLHDGMHSDGRCRWIEAR